jgi:hypothetical protein
VKTDSAAGENVNASNGRATNFLNGLTDSCVREPKNKALVLGPLRFLLGFVSGWAFVIWLRTRGRLAHSRTKLRRCARCRPR